MFMAKRGNCSSCKLLSTHTHMHTHLHTYTQLLLQCDDWQHHSEQKGEWFFFFFFSHKLILRLSLSHTLTLRCRCTLGREGTHCQVVLRPHSSFSNPLSPFFCTRLPHFHPLLLVALCPPRLGSTTQVLHCGRLATRWEWRRRGERLLDVRPA